ncbi:hypothetical protein AB205_0131260 [Aquarana catesbeiana]|uniref:Uncharacterized protein n=1 Tax=Aquarana catesbeiana TaxID=8400 RepID=A0A2G9RK20_AQUCT|nr:hypothetical protein AB205_0131260 [Aquarana catesbeiana]
MKGDGIYQTIWLVHKTSWLKNRTGGILQPDHTGHQQRTVDLRQIRRCMQCEDSPRKCTVVNFHYLLVFDALLPYFSGGVQINKSAECVLSSLGISVMWQKPETGN